MHITCTLLYNTFVVLYTCTTFNIILVGILATCIYAQSQLTTCVISQLEFGIKPLSCSTYILMKFSLLVCGVGLMQPNAKNWKWYRFWAYTFGILKCMTKHKDEKYCISCCTLMFTLMNWQSSEVLQTYCFNCVNFGVKATWVMWPTHYKIITIISRVEYINILASLKASTTDHKNSTGAWK